MSEKGYLKNINNDILYPRTLVECLMWDESTVGTIPQSSMSEASFAALVSGSSLIPGKVYRVDYSLDIAAYVSFYGWQAAEMSTASAQSMHSVDFDIVVIARSSNSIYREALAVDKSTGAQLQLEIKVALYSNKPAVTYMKDKYGNECDFDFKNLVWKCIKNTTLGIPTDIAKQNVVNSYGIGLTCSAPCISTTNYTADSGLTMAYSHTFGYWNVTYQLNYGGDASDDGTASNNVIISSYGVILGRAFGCKITHCQGISVGTYAISKVELLGCSNCWVQGSNYYRENVVGTDSTTAAPYHRDGIRIVKCGTVTKVFNNSTYQCFKRYFKVSTSATGPDYYISSSKFSMVAYLNTDYDFADFAEFKTLFLGNSQIMINGSYGGISIERGNINVQMNDFYLACRYRSYEYGGSTCIFYKTVYDSSNDSFKYKSLTGDLVSFSISDDE